MDESQIQNKTEGKEETKAVESNESEAKEETPATDMIGSANAAAQRLEKATAELKKENDRRDQGILCTKNGYNGPDGAGQRQ